MPATKSLKKLKSPVDPEELFKFISERHPVVIKGLPDDENFRAQRWTDFKYLAAKAGDTEVLVEPIHPASKQYGTDVERVSMSFKKFLASLKGANGPHHYLTTQYSEQEEDQHTVLPPPTNALVDDFPIVPRLMGNLSLQQVNLWIGKSKDGSTSGLHHDFHDNLYCLLRGRKRFVLYPPREIENLYPHGSLDTLHVNGLISYKDARVRSDGLPLRVAIQARIKAVEEKLDALPKTRKKDKVFSKEQERLMAMHDQALDELAQLALEDEGNIDEEVDDFDALMAGLGEEQTDPDEAGPSGPQEDRNDDESEDEDYDEEQDKYDGSEAPNGEDNTSNQEPSSFSRIPTALVHQCLGLPTTAVPSPSVSLSDFPNFKKATKPYVVELSAGEMLYLPASWWHEVTSFSSKGGDGIHMAFNYWFYPPTSNNFDQPYEDTLVWDYLRRKNEVNRRSSNGAGNGKKRKRVTSLLELWKKTKH